jgi:hypothetical protein
MKGLSLRHFGRDDNSVCGRKFDGAVIDGRNRIVIPTEVEGPAVFAK